MTSRAAHGGKLLRTGSWSSSVARAGAAPPEGPGAAVTLSPDADWQKPVDERAAFLAALNAWRAKNGSGLSAAPLQLDARLVLSSDYQTAAMATYEFLAHDDPALPDGKPAIDWVDRIVQSGGYPDNAAMAENLAYGDYSGKVTYNSDGTVATVDYAALIDAVINAFASDEGHRANLLAAFPGVGLSICWSAPVHASDGTLIGGQLPFFAQDFGSAAVVPIGPTPPPAPGPTPTPTPTPTPSSLLGKWRQNAAPHHVIAVVAAPTAPHPTDHVTYENQKGLKGSMTVKKLERNYTQEQA